MIHPSIKFGTDGWRAIIADDYTIPNVKLCAEATARYFLSLSDKPSAVIGYDTRFGSATFAKETALVMAAHGIKVFLAKEQVPTPVTSYGIVTRKATGGVVITASHNPGNWNGFKVKSSDGASLAPENVVIIENTIKELGYDDIQEITLDEALSKGLIEYVDLFPEYAEHISTLVDLEAIKKSNLKIAIDSMHGAGINYFKRIIDGAMVTEIHDDINPNFPEMHQPEPIDANLQILSSVIKQDHFDVGLATDGDADRLGVMDENGVFMTQLEVYALLAYYILEIRKERGAIVKTITTTDMLYKLGEIYNVPVFEVNVGFKYVAPVMMEHDALIGGEESGGYGFKNHIPERDGILAGLYFIDLMLKTGKKPSELLQEVFKKVGTHYYKRNDVTFEPSRRQEIINTVSNAKVESILGIKVDRVRTGDGFKYYLSDGSWVLIRFSGTEPLLRIYTETDTREKVDALLSEAAKIAGV